MNWRVIHIKERVGLVRSTYVCKLIRTLFLQKRISCKSKIIKGIRADSSYFSLMIDIKKFVNYFYRLFIRKEEKMLIDKIFDWSVDYDYIILMTDFIIFDGFVCNEVKEYLKKIDK